MGPLAQRLRTTKRPILGRLFGLARATLFLALAGCHRAPPAAANAPAPAATRAERDGPEAVELSPAQLANAGVRSVRVTPEALAPQLVASAAIGSDPQHLARVGPRVAGRITEVLVNLGDHVRRGQPLLGIDAVEFHDTSREYFQALARSRGAEQALDRARRLVEDGAGSIAERERAQASADAERAALQEAEEHLHALGLNDRDIRALRDRTTHGETHSRVVAPIGGRVTALGVALGQVVAGTEDLVTIADLSTVWATLDVYERDLAAVAVGTAVEVTVPSYPGRVFRGAVEFVSDVVNDTTHTTPVRVRLENGDGALRPGMTATASIRLPAGEPAILLPAEAVQTIEGRRVVFVRAGERRFELRPVGVGPEQGGRVPVLSGLAAGDDAVVAGAYTLRGEHEREAMEGD